MKEEKKMKEENKRETERTQIEGRREEEREGGREGGRVLCEREGETTGSTLHFIISRVWAYSC